MIKKYLYNENVYYSEYAVRQAVWKEEHKVFGKEPDENRAEFWEKLNVVYTEEPDPEPSQAVLAQREIFVLKAQLRETDYVVIKIAEGAATTEEYSEVIAQRETWRARINELEVQLDGEENA
ncbi:hypothetical protein [Parasutterella excrementihominis]|jgi:hypothetical protein|uniref:hypothetical protein n=1 Tax=Parasutterella excrementihominis TaxID=487175 RepID=UPI00204EE44F|nr:MAG TPA: hypothetical protein [Caudoviricetes sp.]